ncbi:hypothetical protein [Candidatus Spongiihabitans sp.]|uniref:hypothetical protein n=1 Tax=Candidatus Spongiihabitans sp. TaxID=3101308 RepID=UPI003C7A2BEB
MPQIAIVKETIAYLKFWLGVLVVSDITLVGWLLTNADAASSLKTYGAIIGITVMTSSALFVHKRIEYMISTLKEL